MGSPFAATSWSHDAQGGYLVGLSTVHTDTVGRFRLAFCDPTTYLPVWEDFSVWSAAVYDVMFGATAPSTYSGSDTSGTLTLLSRLTNTRAINLDNLDVATSTRSTFAGGAVASVIGPVTVGINQDKAGYQLTGSGLDLIQVETGINARQALALTMDAAGSGVLSGATSSTITVRNPTNTQTRIVATVDADGNRSQISLTPPL